MSAACAQPVACDMSSFRVRLRRILWRCVHRVPVRCPRAPLRAGGHDASATAVRAPACRRASSRRGNACSLRSVAGLRRAQPCALPCAPFGVDSASRECIPCARQLCADGVHAQLDFRCPSTSLCDDAASTLADRFVHCPRRRSRRAAAHCADLSGAPRCVTVPTATRPLCGPRARRAAISFGRSPTRLARTRIALDCASTSAALCAAPITTSHAPCRV